MLFRSHFWLLLIQITLFLILAAVLILFPASRHRIFIESALLCFICPTATAAAVVTSKLGGNASSLTSYTILANLLTALAVPIVLPFAHPHEGMDFWNSFLLILSKIFPMLICPFLAAWALRLFLPKLHGKMLKYMGATFYLWAISLSIAIAITTKFMIHAQLSIAAQCTIAGITLAACIIQFAMGKYIGALHNDRISGGQALGQKNTVFAIWMGYTFLSPITSVAGGFYLIWHNVINTYQLYRVRKLEQKS